MALPPHGINQTNAAMATGNDFSMKARILPFLEQAAVWNALNQSFDFNGGQNATGGSTTIRTFLCPSDSNMVQRVRGFVQRPRFRRHQLLQQPGYPAFLNGGMFDGPGYIMGSVYGPTVTLARIHGRASNTAIFSENLMGNSSSGIDLQFRPGVSGPGVVLHHDNGPQHDVAAHPNQGSLAANLQFISQTYCPPNAALSAYSNNGFSWLSSGNGEGGGYSHAQTPNLRNCWGSDQETTSPSAYASEDRMYGA